MVYELTKEGTLKGIGTVSYVTAPFDEEVSLFKRRGLRLIRARELARARIQAGAGSSLFLNGSWVLEGDLYLPASLAEKASIVLLPESLVLENPAGAVAAHRHGQEAIYSDQDKAMHILEQAKEGKEGYFLLASRNAVPTGRFSEEGVTKWLFGKNAGDYGLFLKEAGITAMQLGFDSEEHINKQAGAYVNQLWLGGRNHGSNLLGNNHDLGYYDVARGVPVSARSANAQKKPEPNAIVEAYTPAQVSSALRSLKLSGLEERLIWELRKK